LVDIQSRITVLNSVSFGWLNQQGGFAFSEPFFMDPLVRLDQERRMHAFVAQRFPDEPLYNIEAHLVRIEGRCRPVALVGGIQPNLILAAATGAQFVFPPDKDPDVTPAPLAECQDLDPLRNIEWANTWPVSLLLEQVGRMRERLGSEYAIIPPFFWDTTGRATTHGMLTTAQKLFGERIFIDLIDNPTFVREVMAWVVDAYVRLIHLFASAADMQITGLHTGDCSICMVGPDDFVEFILPELNRFGRAIGPCRLHSCGKSDHLLEAFKLVENVAELNFGSGTSLAAIRERFGPMRVDLMPDTKLLTAGTPADIDAWVRRAMDDNGDGRLEFQFHLDAGQPEANVLQITRTLRELGVSCRRAQVF
jgi:hypothetical protein